MRYYGVCFLSKSTIKKAPILGSVCTSLQSLYVERENKENRQFIFKQLQERLHGFYEGTFATPLMIFPEGKTASNRHLLRFKKGCFECLLPLKPLLIKANNSNTFHHGCGNSDTFLNYLSLICNYLLLLNILIYLL